MFSQNLKNLFFLIFFKNFSTIFDRLVVKELKTKLLFYISPQIFILILMSFTQNKFSLLSYINVSFIVGSIVFLSGILIYVVSGGFFDLFTRSMRQVFTSRSKREAVMSMRLPSEVLDFSASPFFKLGGTILLAMLIALFFYYL